jgi:hypothetical protein
MLHSIGFQDERADNLEPVLIFQDLQGWYLFLES